MLLVQEYLKTHSLKKLGEEHGVFASFSKSGHKFSLNYCQIFSRTNDALASQCRGVILCALDGKSFLSKATLVKGKLNYDDIVPGETKILAYPLNRFLNHNQNDAAKIDWSHPNTSILEKADGSLLICYFDTVIGQWHVATRAVPEADMSLDSGTFTFRSLFEKSLFYTNQETFEIFTSKLDKSFTYCFELTSPFNRIVVEHKTYSLTLLAARDLRTLKEVLPQSISSHFSEGFPQIKEFKFDTIDAAIEWAGNQNPREYEGLVVRDSDFNRIKIKNDQYVIYNKARDTLGASDRNVLSLILSGDEDDFIGMMPQEIAKNILDIKLKVQALIKNHEEVFKDALNQVNQIDPGNKKAFAQIIMKKTNIFTPAMFDMFHGKSANMLDFIKNSKREGGWGNSFLDSILALCGVTGATSTTGANGIPGITGPTGDHGPTATN